MPPILSTSTRTKSTMDDTTMTVKVTAAMKVHRHLRTVRSTQKDIAQIFLLSSDDGLAVLDPARCCTAIERYNYFLVVALSTASGWGRYHYVTDGAQVADRVFCPERVVCQTSCRLTMLYCFVSAFGSVSRAFWDALSASLCVHRARPACLE